MVIYCLTFAEMVLKISMFHHLLCMASILYIVAKAVKLPNFKYFLTTINRKLKVTRIYKKITRTLLTITRPYASIFMENTR